MCYTIILLNCSDYCEETVMALKVLIHIVKAIDVEA